MNSRNGDAVQVFHNLTSWDEVPAHPKEHLQESGVAAELNHEPQPGIRLSWGTLPEVTASAMLQKRTSAKRLTNGGEMTLEVLGTLLKHALGVNELRGDRRTYPSPGALYSNVVYLVVRKVQGLDSGIYRYDAVDHLLAGVGDKDTKDELDEAFLQEGLDFNVCLIVAGRMDGAAAAGFGPRAYRFALMEAGHMAHNVQWVTQCLGWETALIGGFRDNAVNQHLPQGRYAIYLLPIGKEY